MKSLQAAEKRSGPVSISTEKELPTLTTTAGGLDSHNPMAAFLAGGWLGESGRDLHDFAGFAEVYLLEADPCNTVTVEIKAGVTTHVIATYTRIKED